MALAFLNGCEVVTGKGGVEDYHSAGCALNVNTDE